MLCNKIAGNRLSGAIPSEMGHLTSLQHFALSKHNNSEAPGLMVVVVNFVFAILWSVATDSLPLESKLYFFFLNALICLTANNCLTGSLNEIFCDANDKTQSVLPLIGYFGADCTRITCDCCTICTTEDEWQDYKEAECWKLSLASSS